MLDLKKTTEALTGLFFAVVGAGALWLTRAAASSSDSAEGLFFPRTIGLLLLLAGVTITVRDLRRRDGPVPDWRIRTTLAVTGSVVVFAAVIEYGGLIPAVFAAVAISAFGSREARLWPTIALALCVALAMALVFVGLLGQPIKLLGGF